MTTQELFQKHLEAIVAKGDHVPITIEYTISILEDILSRAKNAFNGGQIIHILYDKIEELKEE